MPGIKCMGLHCVPEGKRKVGGRSGKDGCTGVAIVFAVQQPWTVSTVNTKHASSKHRCCTYPKILNHVNYRVAPFPLHSCFVMKTEMNRGFRSLVLFVWVFSPPSPVNPAQLLWNSIRSLGSTAATTTALLRTLQGML